jgi:hypothetical protein
LVSASTYQPSTCTPICVTDTIDDPISPPLINEVYIDDDSSTSTDTSPDTVSKLFDELGLDGLSLTLRLKYVYHRKKIVKLHRLVLLTLPNMAELPLSYYVFHLAITLHTPPILHQLLLKIVLNFFQVTKCLVLLQVIVILLFHNYIGTLGFAS